MKKHRAHGIANQILRRIGLEVRVANSLTDSVLTSVASDLARIRLGHILVENLVSQLGQDIFALIVAEGKRSGFFVEFGAGDGVSLSNTYLLERQYGWHGILGEPNPQYEANLQAKRRAQIDTRCVWSESNRTVKLKQAGYLTSIEPFVTSDHHAKARVGAPGGWFAATTISLVDLLNEHCAPHCIDFLSIDTEGSELEILSAFPWGDRYEFRAIAVEHNYAENRSQIAKLLLNHGYIQVGTDVSKHDDWFVLP